LRARGLLHAARDSRWGHYRPDPDPLVPSARPVLTALPPPSPLAAALLNLLKPAPAKPIKRTHPGLD
jgi:hypothetical protein